MAGEASSDEGAGYEGGGWDDADWEAEGSGAARVGSLLLGYDPAAAPSRNDAPFPESFGAGEAPAVYLGGTETPDGRLEDFVLPWGDALGRLRALRAQGRLPAQVLALDFLDDSSGDEGPGPGAGRPRRLAAARDLAAARGAPGLAGEDAEEAEEAEDAEGAEGAEDAEGAEGAEEAEGAEWEVEGAGEAGGAGWEVGGAGDGGDGGPPTGGGPLGEGILGFARSTAPIVEPAPVPIPQGDGILAYLAHPE